jgi:hypothetical protein
MCHNLRSRDWKDHAKLDAGSTPIGSDGDFGFRAIAHTVTGDQVR